MLVKCLRDKSKSIACMNCTSFCCDEYETIFLSSLCLNCKDIDVKDLTVENLFKYKDYNLVEVNIDDFLKK